MKFTTNGCDWLTLPSLAKPGSPYLYRCLVFVCRPWLVPGCWVAYRLTEPGPDVTDAPGYYRGASLHVYHRTGYGRTRADAVAALQTACRNGWGAAGWWAYRSAVKAAKRAGVLR